MDGTPDLHDPTYRCSPCTDQHGRKQTNCGNPESYMGRIAKSGSVDEGAA
jgi:hypothetical protein